MTAYDVNDLFQVFSNFLPGFADANYCHLAFTSNSSYDFNTGVNSLAAVAAGMVLFALSPQGPSLALTIGAMIPAVAAGIALFATNLALVDSMVTLRKGMGYWKDSHPAAKIGKRKPSEDASDEA